VEVALSNALEEVGRPVVSLSGDHGLLVPFPLDGQLDVGRQRPGDPPPDGLVSTPDGIRLIVAAALDPSISRQQLLIHQTSESVITVANTRRNRAIAVAGLGAIDAGSSANCQFPVRIHVARATFLCIDRSE